MAILLSEVQAEVLNILQKSPTYQGFYTTDKVTRAINESFAYVVARMMMEGNGWRQTIAYITSVANTPTYALPTDASIINAVRYRYGDVYVPLTYEDQSTTSQSASNSQVAGATGTYRLVGNQLYFNPVPQMVGTDYIQIEYTTYPAALSVGTDPVPTEFDKGLYYYVVYRSCGILVGQSGNAQPEWQLYEVQWFNVMENIISKRLRVQQVIGEFGGSYY